jgi:ATP-binding cassette subfamily C protein LapB
MNPSTPSTRASDSNASISDASPVHDGVLQCLVTLAHEFDLPVNRVSMAQGFATDDDGRVNVDAYPDLARKHGMIAAWSQAKASSLPSYVLPVVVPLIDGRAAILRGISNGEATVTFSDAADEQSQETIALDKLDALATNQILVVKAGAKKGVDSLSPFKGEAFNWFWGTLWRFRKFYFESMFATILANILTLATIFFTMNVYNRVVPTSAYASLWTLAIGTSLAIVFEFLMRWLKARMVDLGGKKADLAINATLLREIMTIRLEHRPNSIGVFASSMRDFDALRDFFSSASLVLLADLPFIFMFLGIIWLIGGPIVIVPLIAIPILILVGVLSQPALTRAIRQNMKEAGDRQSVLVESILNLESLKAHNEQRYLQRRWEVANLASADSYKATRAVTNLITGLTAMLQQLTTVGVIVVGVYLIHSKNLTLGALIACVMLASRAIAPLGSIMSLAARYQQAVNALEILESLMKRPRDQDSDMQYIVPDRFSGALQTKELEFAYPSSPGQPVLRRISLDVKTGERFALVGTVGSGKSTLLRLMSGLYTPLGGAVLMDGVDIRQIDPTAFRDKIGYVGQDTQLFMGTLRQNLVLSNPSISDQKILDVLKALGLYELVASSARGLDMLLTEAGGGLSGGQRQLLSIARMMLRNPVYVFMDEPTAHMDAQTEVRVIKVLQEWSKGRTVILSSHRTQLLALVNRVVMLDRGAVFMDTNRDDFLTKMSGGRPANAAGPAAGPSTAPTAPSSGPTKSARSGPRYQVKWGK